MERIYRDPVHNIIRLHTNTKEGELLVHLTDSAEFQRLRRIKQLGLALYAYQGAEHSRFAHSLGALHLITRILERLAGKYKILDEHRIAVRAAALLHDVGHGPFSHVMESVLNFHHEDITVQAVLSDQTEIGQILHNYCGEIQQNIADIITGSFRPMALAQLVSSQLDADRMDYLLRDSLMTGAKYGIYDLEWIIKTLEVDEADDRIYVSANGLYAVEAYLQARYYMFRQVYFHRTLRSAEVVLRATLRRALELYQQGESVWVAPNTAFEKILSQKDLELRDLLELDDSDIIFHIKQWQRSSDVILADLSSRFINRRLFKAFDLDMPDEERNRFLLKAREIVTQAGFNTDYYFAEDWASDVPYYSSDYCRSSQPLNLIYVEEGYSRSRIRELSEISAAVRGLQQGYQIHRVCFPLEVMEKMALLYYCQ